MEKITIDRFSKKDQDLIQTKTEKMMMKMKIQKER